ncbi:hypothetical protein AB0H83_44905 [Dactylosporangium sp. NPDC050688]|uniref:hypothetical protein n=1 Tax=Dactylosporangium sp. NPDC050688 TaxID=3157217 RepID=UPI0033C67F05
MPSPFDPTSVHELAEALPPTGANPAADAARTALVRWIKLATPGRQSIGGAPFRTVFFPGTAAGPDDAKITALTGLGADFFAAFATVTLCDRMHQTTRVLQPQLVGDRIDAGVAEHNRTLRPRVRRWYGQMLSATPGPVATALRAFGTDQQRRLALGHYVAGLTSPTWINDKLSQDRLGFWPDRDWELFHHYVKLGLLGATFEQVDDVIRRIRAGGVPVPDALGVERWQTWSRWWAGDIDGWDLADATGPILATTYQVVVGAPWPATMPEGNSYEFTANTMPGSPYRQVPQRSCFAPGTRIVMADGSLRAVEHVRPGDAVSTPAGPRDVVFHSSPPRAGRTLARFTDAGFSFAATHPFVVRGGAAAYAAADPTGLAETVPSLAQYGIRPLDGADRPVLSRYTRQGDRPHRPGRIVAADDEPERLHDLFLAVGPDGRSEFYAGDEHLQLLVSSEAPRFTAAPEAAAVVLGVLTACADTVLGVLAPMSDEAFADVLAIGLDAVARRLLADVGPSLTDQAVATAGPGAAVTTAADIAAALTTFARTAGAADATTRRRLGLLVEAFVPRFAEQFQAAVALGWRRWPGPEPRTASLLAVTVHAVDLLARPGAVQADGARVTVTLRRDAARSGFVLPVEPSRAADRHRYTVDAVGYFSQWRPILEAPVEAQREQGWTLHVAVDGDPAVAVLTLPRLLDPGYAALVAPLVDPGGATVGRVSLDLRALTPGDLEQEEQARRAWNPDRRPVIAGRLTALASAYVLDQFGAAVHAFGRYAAVERTPIVR